MKTVTLLPLLHKQAEQIGLQFIVDAELNKLVKKLKGIKWSRNNKCWYLPLTKENYTAVINAINGKAIADTTLLKQYMEKKKQIGKTEKNVGKKNKSSHIDVAAYAVSDKNLKALELLTNTLQLKAYSSSTIKTYKNEFCALLQLLKNKPVSSLTTEEIKRYILYCINTLQLSENTIHSRLNALKFYFEQVLKKDKIFVEIPRPKKRMILPKVISEEKIIKGLLKIENLKHKALLMLAYSAGLRVSEVVALKITDIDSDRMQITIHNAKGKKDRVGTLSKSILAILRTYFIAYKPKQWLFEGQYRNEHYSTRSAQIIFKDAYKNLQLPAQCSFHSLRHSYATHLLENGTDISYIQQLLGHNDIKTTLRYTQVSKKEIGKIESPLDKIIRKITEK